MKQSFATRKFILLSLVSVILTALSVYLDAPGYLVNTGAGLIGAVIGIWVSIEIVEKLLDEQRARDWNRVRVIVIQNVIIQLNQITTKYLRLLHQQGTYFSLTKNMQQINEEKLGLLSHLEIELAGIEFGDSRHSSIKLYEQVLPNLQRLHDIQIFHLLLPGQAIDLAKRLQELEIEGAQWSEVIMQDQRIGLSGLALAEPANSTFKKVREILEYLHNSDNSS